MRFAGGFKIEGAREISAALGKLGEEVGEKLTQKAAREGTKVLHGRVVSAAPVGPGSDKFWVTKSGDVQSRNYGHLRDNIRMKITPKRYRRGSPDHSAQYDITTGDAFWAWFLEFGTSKMQAYPFMRESLDAGAPVSVEVMKTVLWAGIQSAAKKAAR